MSTTKKIVDDSDLRNRVRAWAFTSFATNDDGSLVKPIFNEKVMRYLLFAPEVCPTTGRPHYQGYVQFHSPTQGTCIRNKHYLPRDASLRACRGKVQQNREYIVGPYEDLKTGKTKPYNPNAEEFGKAVEERQRTDLMTLVTSNDTYDACMMSDPELTIKYNNGIRSYYSIKNADYVHTNEVPEVYWFWGDDESYLYSTVGDLVSYFTVQKNYRIWEMGISSGLWFDGYCGQEIAFISGLSAARVPCEASFRRILRGNINVQCKHGFTKFNPKVIIITSRPHPLNINFKGTTLADRRSLVKRVEYISTNMQVFEEAFANKGDLPLMIDTEVQFGDDIGKIQIAVNEELERDDLGSQSEYDEVTDDSLYEACDGGVDTYIPHTAEQENARYEREIEMYRNAANEKKLLKSERLPKLREYLKYLNDSEIDRFYDASDDIDGQYIRQTLIDENNGRYINSIPKVYDSDGLPDFRAIMRIAKSSGYFERPKPSFIS